VGEAAEIREGCVTPSGFPCAPEPGTLRQNKVATAHEGISRELGLIVACSHPRVQVITHRPLLSWHQRKEIDILRRRVDLSVLLVKAVGGGWTSRSCRSRKVVEGLDGPRATPSALILPLIRDEAPRGESR
jgi:hypothetical protein